MKVAILGCGPAGLVAAHTATGLGHDVTIITNKVMPSQVFGCQYLHAPIPGYEDVPQVRVNYQLRGTPEDYKYKVYGQEWEGKISPEDFIGEHDAWDIRETYHRLWYDLFMRKDIPIAIHDVRRGSLGPALGSDKIVSTIPATALCAGGHLFRSHAIYATGDRENNGSRANEVFCDGTPDVDWYRRANVFGYKTTEWPSRLFETPAVLYTEIQEPPPLPPKWSARVVKPLSTECNCHPGIVRAGRYGEWRKSRLVHEVPGIVTKALS